MRCMTKTKAHEDKNPTTRKYHNLVLEMARVGIQIWEATYGVLHKRTILKDEISTMLANYSFKDGVPKKLGDPGIPTIPTIT